MFNPKRTSSLRRLDFRTAETQYADLRVSLPEDALSNGEVGLGTPLETQLFMEINEMPFLTLAPDRERELLEVKLTADRDPTYLACGPVKEVVVYDDAGYRVEEFLVDAGVSLVAYRSFQGPRLGRRRERPSSFWGVGTLWGDVSWHDGAIFRPVRGFVRGLRHVMRSPGGTDVVITLELTQLAKPLHKLSWFPPEDESDKQTRRIAGTIAPSR